VAQQPPPPPPSYPPPPPPAPGGQYPGARPGTVAGVGILLIILGSLRGLFALIAVIVVIGASDEITGDLGGAALGIVIVALLITVAVGLLQILGGANTLRLRRRGFVLGLTGSVIGIVLGLLGLLGGGAEGLTIVINVLVLIGDIVAVVLLSQNSRYLTQQ
jgi:hypothetical protein